MSEIKINTTQNIPIFFSTASVGERMLAYILDMVIKISYMITLVLLISYTGIKDLFESWDNWSIGALMMFLYAPVAFYSVICESLMEGQTFGKKALKMRVVKIDGYQASFVDYVTRWLFRLIDIDFGYFIGLLSVTMSKNSQRLGDLAAGTAVITDKARYNISHTILAEVAEDYVPTFSHMQVIRFSDNDIRIIKENMIEAMKRRDEALLTKLTQKIEEVMQITNPFQYRSDFIKKLIEDYNYYTGQ